MLHEHQLLSFSENPATFSKIWPPDIQFCSYFSFYILKLSG